MADDTATHTAALRTLAEQIREAVRGIAPGKAHAESSGRVWIEGLGERTVAYLDVRVGDWAVGIGEPVRGADPAGAVAGLRAKLRERLTREKARHEAMAAACGAALAVMGTEER